MLCCFFYRRAWDCHTYSSAPYQYTSRWQLPIPRSTCFNLLNCWSNTYVPYHHTEIIVPTASSSLPFSYYTLLQYTPSSYLVLCFPDYSCLSIMREVMNSRDVVVVLEISQFGYQLKRRWFTIRSPPPLIPEPCSGFIFTPIITYTIPVPIRISLLLPFTVTH